MFVTLKSNGNTVSVSEEEGWRLITAELATFSETARAGKKREKAVKSKREKR